MPSALLLPVLTCAVVLLVSGVAKLRAPATVDTAFTSLRVPRVVDTPVVRRLVPWVEVALGAWLLLATGPALVVVALLTLALFVAYLVLVVRAVRGPEPVDCGCFGAIGDSRVTRVTVWRNVALVVSSALAVVAGLRGAGLLPALRDDDRGLGVGRRGGALRRGRRPRDLPRSGDCRLPAEAEVDSSGEYVREHHRRPPRCSPRTASSCCCQRRVRPGRTCSSSSHRGAARAAAWGRSWPGGTRSRTWWSGPCLRGDRPWWTTG